jgi:hypothetical protein
VQEGQVRVSWGATQGNPVTGKGIIGGETMAFLNRLEVLGEALLLNDEFINSCNYNAATDQVRKERPPLVDVLISLDCSDFYCC